MAFKACGTPQCLEFSLAPQTLPIRRLKRDPYWLGLEVY